MVELKVETRRLRVVGAENANRRWPERRSWLVQLQGDGVCGYGEAAPLPDFSKESEVEVQAALEHAQNQELEALTRNPASASRGDTMATLPALSTAPASVRFALQSAWLDRLGQRLGRPVWQLLSRDDDGPHPGLSAVQPRPAAQLFSLTQSPPETALGACSSAPALKAKIGRDLPAELQQLRLLRPLWQRPLRLDANGSLGPNWESTLRKLAAFDPEFVEEPRPIADLGEPRALPCPIAFDESLRDAAPAAVEAWLRTGSVRALVLKPMLLGDLAQVHEWVLLARRYGVACIFSHLFDGSVAMATYQHLALAWGDDRLCSGLGAHAAQNLWPLQSHTLNAPGLGLRAV